jgi:hypothetical protein
MVAKDARRQSPSKASTSDKCSWLKREDQDRELEPVTISATAHKCRSELEGAAMPVADSSKPIFVAKE